MPTTRVAFPRCVVAYDEEGQECFRSLTLWVLMDMDSRTMVLPGKSGVTVEGLLRGGEPATPVALTPCHPTDARSRTVCFTDLDRNGHMNNTRYMDWVADLLPSSFHENHPFKGFTVCYMAEAREDDEISLDYDLDEGANLTVCAHRAGEAGEERIFSAQVQF
jgi:medium-chain acyl-[acyl-carrier-protein] hydrolase